VRFNILRRPLEQTACCPPLFASPRFHRALFARSPLNYSVKINSFLTGAVTHPHPARQRLLLAVTLPTRLRLHFNFQTPNYCVRALFLRAADNSPPLAGGCEIRKLRPAV